MNDTHELTVWQILEAIARRRRIAIGVFVAMMLVGIAIWKIWPRAYGSEGRLFVQVGRTNLGLDPTNAPKPVAIQDLRETEIRSVMEIVKSQGVLLSVVDEVGADKILANPFDKFTKWLTLPSLGSLLGKSADGEFSPEEFERLKKRELAAKAIGENLTVFLEKNSSIIEIFVKANSSRLAQQIVEKLMKKTSEMHMTAHSVKSSYGVFESEVKRHEKLLDEALGKMKDFHNSRGVLSVPSARSTLQAQIDRIEMDMLDVELNLAQFKTRAKDLRKRIEGLGEFVDAPSQGLESSSTEGARAELFRMEAERSRLLATFSPSHPKVLQLNEQLEKVQAELGRMPKVRSMTTAVVNPVYSSIKVELINQETAMAGFEARRIDLISKRVEALKKLHDLNEDDVASQKLAQDISVAQRYLDVYVQKSGETQVLDELDRQNISDVVVSQPALLLVKHVSPKGSIVLPLLAVTAFGTSLLVALGADLLYVRRERLRGPIDRGLSVPVLVTLPPFAARHSVHS